MLCELKLKRVAKPKDTVELTECASVLWETVEVEEERDVVAGLWTGQVGAVLATNQGICSVLLQVLVEFE